jgi:glutamate/tyrosine decarboxylase-like PLP-dependent enzyme
MKKHDGCSPKDFLLKAYFLAPGAENSQIVETATNFLYQDWFQWRKKTAQQDGPFFSSSELQEKKMIALKRDLLKKIQNLTLRFHHEIPRHSPRYIGHMYSDFSLPAFFGHLIALIYNPNNIASESSRVGVKVERESIRYLTNLFGWPKQSAGHFTSCGTIANLEFFYRLKTKTIEKMKASKWKKWVVYVPESAHYSWIKAESILSDGRLILEKIPVNKSGEMNLTDLKATIESDLKKNHLPAGVVSICGSTEIGAFDSTHEIQALIKNFEKIHKKLKIWHHVDGAYGGFFATLQKDSKAWKSITPELRKKLLALKRVDSITLDPHKLGYTPYSVGCFICKSEEFYRTNHFGAKYVQFKNSVDPGPFTIEGSRSAAGALAVNLTVKTMGWEKIGRIIYRSILSAKDLRRRLEGDFFCLQNENSNIVCFTAKGKKNDLKSLNKKTEVLYKKINHSKNKNQFFVSKTTLGNGNEKTIESFCQKHDLKKNTDELFLIRCTVMNPFISSRYSSTNFFDAFHILLLEASKKRA